MIHTIPTVSRIAGKRRWISSSIAFVLASVLAGIITGALVGFMGHPLVTLIGSGSSTAIAAILVSLLGLAGLELIGIPRFQRNAQVPEDWRRRFRPEVSATLYGAMLGTAILTKIPFWSTYAVLVSVFFSGSAGSGAIIYGAFALHRSMPQAMLTPFVKEGYQASSLVAFLMPHQQLVGRVDSLLMVLIGVALTDAALA